MLAPYNFLSPANGEPIVMPSQDMVLGCYYLTVNNIMGLLGSNHYFADLEDVILAYNQNKIELHSSIWIRIKDDNQSKSNLIKQITLNDNTIVESYENLQIRKNEEGNYCLLSSNNNRSRNFKLYNSENFKFFIN